VEGGGFEPPKAEPSDLQSDPFDHSGTPPKNQARYCLVRVDECQHKYLIQSGFPPSATERFAPTRLYLTFMDDRTIDETISLCFT
jgi:hypothetical protein